METKKLPQPEDEFPESRKDRRVSSINVSLLAALLYFFAIGYNRWGWGDNILGSYCIKTKVYETTGAILLTAGIFLILRVVLGDSWTEIVSAVFTTLAAMPFLQHLQQ